METQVMLVDDEAPFVDALAQRLSMRGFTVAKAYSGDTCLQVLSDRHEEVDVVVLDLLMPGISGIEVLKEIRKKNPLIQIILLSGQATVESAIEGMKQGAYDFLLKPADTEVLSAKIEAAAAIKKAHEERIRKAEMDTIITERGW
ncbi:response regulator [Desulfobotulus sp. H1]|uniref:Response regulator n=1 Tax=Desulfobotulus pelophilus TaxID=2823377 RepID=A0ABT3N943_9BACT|nr:response regulator [Desulfobotulus pelophilus]MCW7753984.1 response regulator [Desulfobotulus pelophilus]